MAKPIRNTPTLYGKDAECFLTEISIVPSAEERSVERERIRISVNDFISLIAQYKDA